MILRLSLLLGVLLLAGFTDTPPPAKPLDPVEAAKQGKDLVAEILARAPAQNFTNSGVLKIRDAKGQKTEVPVTFEILVTPTNWLSIYEAGFTNRMESFLIVHSKDQPVTYYWQTNFSTLNVPLLNDLPLLGHLFRSSKISAAQLAIPLAGSDFWLTDVGLEFFHWPEQKILKSELRKTRLCRVLESTNPRPARGAYSRVVSWLDDESMGILHAEAYDSQNKLLKEFDTKKFKKIQGEWQLEEMEIYNSQTHSRSQLQFNFASP